jgi:DNA-binding transcriptional LysR family regulator
VDRFTSMLVFAKAVETGSFIAAAEALSMSSQMVGKHVSRLEAQLGARLINRTTRRQSLTELGRKFHEHVRTILAEVEAVENLAERSRATPRGQLRISAPVTFGAHELSEALPQYLSRYPEVSIELTLNDRVVDIIEEGYDAVIRVGPLSNSGLVARKLRAYELTLCASPEYLNLRGIPATPADLQDHECLCFYHGMTGEHWNFASEETSMVVDVSHRFVVNNGQALLTAALAGGGIIFQPASLTQRDIEAGRLVRLLTSFTPSPRPMHLLYSPDRRMTPKLRSFNEFIVKRFGSGAI